MQLDPRLDKRKLLKLRSGLLKLIAHLPEDCIMAEIGSYSGDSAVFFASHVKHLYCIDPWGRLDLAIVKGKQKRVLEQHSFDKVEEHFDHKTQQFSNIEKLKLFSEEAAAQFQNVSLDFVYIDALHTYEAVKKDIERWKPKIKLGGQIGGHDYNLIWPGVKKAVNEAFKKPHFVFEDHSWLVKL